MDDIDVETQRRGERLAGMTELHQRIGQALAGRYADRIESEHVEQQIYSGFYGADDTKRLHRFQNETWDARAQLVGEFNDHRLQQLGRRQVLLNSPELLEENIVYRLRSAILDRWQSVDPDVPWTTFVDVDQQLEEIEQAGAMDQVSLQGLRTFYESLKAQ